MSLQPQLAASVLSFELLFSQARASSAEGWLQGRRVRQGANLQLGARRRQQQSSRPHPTPASSRLPSLSNRSWCSGWNAIWLSPGSRARPTSPGALLSWSLNPQSLCCQGKPHDPNLGCPSPCRVHHLEARLAKLSAKSLSAELSARGASAASASASSASSEKLPTSRNRRALHCLVVRAASSHPWTSLALWQPGW